MSAIDLKLKNISLIAVQAVKLKQLLPGTKPPWDGRALEAAQPELEREVENYFTRIREKWGYRRKELSLSVESPLSRAIQTPDFQYQISLEIDPEDPSQALWRREILNLRSTEVMASPLFEQAFGDVFGKAIFNFETKIPIPDVIDRIEERDRPEIKLSYDSQCQWCQIHVGGMSGTLTLQGDSITVESPGSSLTSTLMKLLGTISNYCDIGVATAALT